MKSLLLVFTLLLSACSVKNYEHTHSKIIIIKSPKIKFADIGYIRNSDQEIELELFIAGKVIDRISINHLICTSGSGCMSKSSFNEEYLSGAYPSDILQNILLGKAIYDGKNLEKTQNGFVQEIKSDEVDISYSVTPAITSFKDRKNNIIFKIKEPK